MVVVRVALCWGLLWYDGEVRGRRGEVERERRRTRDFSILIFLLNNKYII